MKIHKTSTIYQSNFLLTKDNREEKKLINQNKSSISNKQLEYPKIHPVRLPLFEYPPIPEINFCIAITIGSIIYGWYCVYSASQKYTFKIGDAASIGVLPFFGARFKVPLNISFLLEII